jgi:(1->4)-alpha-D-glucan 1-alpha-D-glucosylmutase
LFSSGEYIPLPVTGTAADHVIPFARRFGDDLIVVVLPRLVYRLLGSNKAAENTTGASPRFDWQDTRISLPAEFPTGWRNELSGESVDFDANSGEASIELNRLLNIFPVAVLRARTS